MKEAVFLNGKFLTSKDAKISVLEPGFLYGWGLFETMRSYNNKIVYFDQHLKRIKRSCRLIQVKFPYSIGKLKGIIQRAVKLSDGRDVYVRLTLWKSDIGTGTLITTRKCQPYSFKKYREGLRACISLFRQNESSCLSQIKTTNYLLYRLSLMQAKNNGFDEGIILNNRGYIAEASRSNIFFVKDKEIFTPALECGCLDGITRRVIFDFAKKHKLKIQEGKFIPSDLYEADEAFLTNSLMGVMPLTRLEKKPIAKGLAGRTTKLFIKKYNLLLKNGT